MKTSFTSPSSGTRKSKSSGPASATTALRHSWQLSSVLGQRSNHACDLATESLKSVRNDGEDRGERQNQREKKIPCPSTTTPARATQKKDKVKIVLVGLRLRHPPWELLTPLLDMWISPPECQKLTRPGQAINCLSILRLGIFPVGIRFPWRCR
jgi:hypothetical protein